MYCSIHSLSRRAGLRANSMLTISRELWPVSRPRHEGKRSLIALLLQLLIKGFPQSLNRIVIQLGGLEQARYDRLSRPIEHSINKFAQHNARYLLFSDQRFEAESFSFNRLRLLQLLFANHSLKDGNHRCGSQHTTSALQQFASPAGCQRRLITQHFQDQMFQLNRTLCTHAVVPPKAKTFVPHFYSCRTWRAVRATSMRRFYPCRNWGREYLPSVSRSHARNYRAHKKRHSGRVECSTGVPLPDPILIATDQGCGMFINEFRRWRRPVDSASQGRQSPGESPVIPVAPHEHHRQIRGRR